MECGSWLVGVVIVFHLRAGGMVVKSLGILPPIYSVTLDKPPNLSVTPFFCFVHLKFTYKVILRIK